MILTIASVTLTGLAAYALTAGFAVLSALALPRAFNFVRKQFQGFKLPDLLGRGKRQAVEQI